MADFPDPVDDLPCPEGLDGRAKDCWEYYAPLLIEKQALTKWDVGSFELLCKAFDAAMEAYEIFTSDGIVLKKENGTQLKHPAVAIYNQNMKSFLDYAKEFGLTPMSRKRIDIKLSTVKKKNKFEGM